jgi:membrane protein YqaA with SNARE-associated domain
MLQRLAEDRLLRAVLRAADRPGYPLIVGAAAFGATLSMAVPFATVLVAAVLAAPRRWRAIALWSSLGTGLAGLVLYLAFHHLGWALFAERHPEIAASRAWLQASAWLSQWGLLALLAIAALPLPQTPAVAFAALARLSVPGVLAALVLGKLVKYAVYAWATSRFPDWFRSRMHAGHAFAARPDAPPASPALLRDNPLILPTKVPK